PSSITCDIDAMPVTNVPTWLILSPIYVIVSPFWKVLYTFILSRRSSSSGWQREHMAWRLIGHSSQFLDSGLFPVNSAIFIIFSAYFDLDQYLLFL
ncbi:MAG: hypothetical protein P8N58_09915, partial [Emcibacteraceae bacterium]|nr:hypothetical protein [Emcibacteraceae bacterium]